MWLCACSNHAALPTQDAWHVNCLLTLHQDMQDPQPSTSQQCCSSCLRPLLELAIIALSDIRAMWSHMYATMGCLPLQLPKQFPPCPAVDGPGVPVPSVLPGPPVPVPPTPWPPVPVPPEPAAGKAHGSTGQKRHILLHHEVDVCCRAHRT